MLLGHEVAPFCSATLVHFYSALDRLSSTPEDDFVALQRRVFQEAESNLEGLRLEFRRKYGQYGSSFHDRFLIFPRTLHRETLVWSLGTSINGIVKRNEMHTFVVLPKRWVVERCFGWLEKCRRLWKNCERKLNTSLQFVHLAFLGLLLRRS
jgi:hypothetical protein